MKYNTGSMNIIDDVITLNVNCDMLGKNSSTTSPIPANNPKFANITNIKCLGYESAKDLPSLLKNPCSLSKVILAAFFVKYGTSKIVAQNKIRDSVAYPLRQSVKIIPKVIPAQNFRFSKLSLPKLGLVNFIRDLILKIKSIKYSLAELFVPCKNTLAILLTLTMGISTTPCLAEDLLQLVSHTEELYSIPSGLLWAIATVESGGRQYALNVGGKAVIASSQVEAVRIASYYIEQGITNIDLGTMQINLRSHGKEFNSIDEMLNPKHNIEYAAKFLTKLYKQHGTWQKAVRYYHSAKPKFHREYSHKVLTSWLRS